MSLNKMTIGATIMENLDTLNKTVQNEGEKAIVEMKIQRVTELGNKEKQGRRQRLL